MSILHGEQEEEEEQEEGGRTRPRPRHVDLQVGRVYRLPQNVSRNAAVEPGVLELGGGDGEGVGVAWVRALSQQRHRVVVTVFVPLDIRDHAGHVDGAEEGGGVSHTEGEVLGRLQDRRQAAHLHVFDAVLESTFDFVKDTLSDFFPVGPGGADDEDEEKPELDGGHSDCL